MSFVDNDALHRKIKAQRSLVLVSLMVVTIISIASPAKSQDGAVGATSGPPPPQDTTLVAYWHFAEHRASNMDIWVQVRATSNGKAVSQQFDLHTGGRGDVGFEQQVDGTRIASFSLWSVGHFGNAAVHDSGEGGCETAEDRHRAPGIRCVLDFEWELNAIYTLRLWRTPGTATTDTWSAWIIDNSRTFHKVGSIEVDKPLRGRSHITRTTTKVKDLTDDGSCESPLPFTARVWRPRLVRLQARLAAAPFIVGAACANGGTRSGPGRFHKTMSIGTGPIEFVGVGGQCLTLPGNDRSNGVDLEMNTCTGARGQTWVVQGDVIKLAGTNLCLDVEGSSAAEATSVQTWACTGNSNQRWAFKGNGQIVGFADMCLDVEYAGQTPSTRVQIWQCQTRADHLPAQTWLRKAA